VVVTGPPGGGKTRAATELAGRLRDHGVAVAGFVQPGEVEKHRKVAFAVRDVATGEEAVLARRDPREEGDFGTRFRFFDVGFDLARKALERAQPGSILIVDELGPVELRGDGHMPAVRRAVSQAGLAGAVIVVRRTLVPALLAALDATDAVVVDVEEYGDAAPAVIARALGLHWE
jgi:nucleoside-triphosphatase THEP1